MRVVLLLICFLVVQTNVIAAPQDACVRITSHGCSGTIIHTQAGVTWILTCAHAFVGNDLRVPVVIHAPAITPGAVKTGGIRVVKVDYMADLVLIEMRTGPMRYVCHVAPKGFRPSRCLSAGYDRMLNQQTVRTATIVRTGVQETHTAEQPWHGRSGGALIDQRSGRLVGVVSGYTTEPGGRFVPGVSYGVYASLDSVHRFVWPTRTSSGGSGNLQQTPAPQFSCPSGRCGR